MFPVNDRESESHFVVVSADKRLRLIEISKSSY